MDHKLPRIRFNICQLMLVTLVYAFLFAILSAMPLSTVQIVAASGVVTVFVLADLVWASGDRAFRPILVRAALAVAKYATSFAVAVAVCFALWIAGTDTIVVGAELDVQTLLLAYLGLFAALSTIAFVASLVASQHYNLAIGLMFLNTPGVTLLSFMIYAVWHIKYVHG